MAKICFLNIQANRMTHQISFGLPDIANVTPKIDNKGLIPVNVIEHVFNDVDDQDEKFVDEKWLSVTHLKSSYIFKAVLPTSNCEKVMFISWVVQ